MRLGFAVNSKIKIMVINEESQTGAGFWTVIGNMFYHNIDAPEALYGKKIIGIVPILNYINDDYVFIGPTLIGSASGRIRVLSSSGTATHTKITLRVTYMD